MRRFAVYILYIIAGIYCFGQTNSILTYSITAGYGYVARTNDFMRGENIDNKDINSVKNFAFEICKETDGSEQWHHFFKNLHYGAGFFHGWFNYSKNLGNPSGLYGFIGFMPVDTRHWFFRTDIALGISGIWDGYSRENYYNIAVSTPVECYIHGRLALGYNVNGNWHLSLTGAFIHFSNGCIKRPNKGINILTPAIGVAYNPRQIIKTDFYTRVPFLKNSQRLITLYDAIKGNYVDYTKTVTPLTNDTIRDTIREVHWIFGMQYREVFALSHTQNLGLGMDVSYNNVIDKTKGYNYKYPSADNGFDLKKVTLSAFISYEYCINNLSFVMEPMIYVYKPRKTYFTKFSQRIGLRYRIYKGFYYQLTLRAYQFTKADYIEGGIGYRFKYSL